MQAALDAELGEAAQLAFVDAAIGIEGGEHGRVDALGTEHFLDSS